MSTYPVKIPGTTLTFDGETVGLVGYGLIGVLDGSLASTKMQVLRLDGGDSVARSYAVSADGGDSTTVYSPLLICDDGDST